MTPKVKASVPILLNHPHAVPVFKLQGKVFSNMAATGNNDSFIGSFALAQCVHQLWNVWCGLRSKDFITGLKDR